MSIDLTNHGGLRGFCAIWIMLFHYILYSTFPIDFQGSSFMPLYFLLSGFSLVIGYEPKQPLNQDNIEDHSMHSEVDIPFEPYFQNRLARTLPVYYVCNALSIPYWISGFGDTRPSDYIGIIISVITTFIPLNTTFIFLLGTPIDGPSWTVATLIIMWIFFPISYKYIHKLTNEGLIKMITNLYWLQMIIIFVVFFILLLILGFWPAFAASTMNPFSRLPLFFMGIGAGELVVRHRDSSLYWLKSMFIFPSGCICSSVTPLQTDSSFDWASHLNTNASYLMGLTLLISFIDALLRHFKSSGGLLGAVWWQALVPFLQLQIIVALIMDSKNQSIVTRFFRGSIIQYLGKLSMCIYLIHMPIMYYLDWAYLGRSLTWPSNDDFAQGCSNYQEGTTQRNECEDRLEDFSSHRQLQLWLIPVAVVITLLLSYFFYHYIEEPTRIYFRSQQNGYKLHLESVRKNRVASDSLHS